MTGSWILLGAVLVGIWALAYCIFIIAAVHSRIEERPHGFSDESWLDLDLEALRRARGEMPANDAMEQ